MRGRASIVFACFLIYQRVAAKDVWFVRRLRECRREETLVRFGPDDAGITDFPGKQHPGEIWGGAGLYFLRVSLFINGLRRIMFGSFVVLVRFGPNDALVFLGDIHQAAVVELLDALAAVGFGGVDVPFGVRGDGVYGVELTGLTAAIAEGG